MKNQYFGDINDYRKYGILRALLRYTDIKLLVAWMLTTDDGRTDGKFIEYLSQPERWGHHDPDLYEFLQTSLTGRTARSVSQIEPSGMLGPTRFFSKLVPDSLNERRRWSNDLVDQASQFDLVFLDPDNGIEVKSKPMGRKDSSKFAYWSEIEATWATGASMLIYQHFPRVKRDVFVLNLVSEIRTRLGAGFVRPLVTPNVVFLLAGQTGHTEQLERGSAAVENDWAGQIRIG